MMSYLDKLAFKLGALALLVAITGIIAVAIIKS